MKGFAISCIKSDSATHVDCVQWLVMMMILSRMLMMGVVMQDYWLMVVTMGDIGIVVARFLFRVFVK